MAKLVRQEDGFGCGVACVASINNVSYKYSKNKFFSQGKNAKTIGFLCKDIVSALKKSGSEYSYKYLKRKQIFSNLSIAFIKRSSRYPGGHYLLKMDKGWMDPWINFDAKNPDVAKSKAGYRKRLPGKAIYLIFPQNISKK